MFTLLICTLVLGIPELGGLNLLQLRLISVIIALIDLQLLFNVAIVLLWVGLPALYVLVRDHSVPLLGDIFQAFGTLGCILS